MSENPTSHLPATSPPLVEQPLAAESWVDRLPPALRGLAELTLARQLGLMLGLALSVAIGVAVVLWSQAPSYSVLFGSLAEKDAAEIVEALDKLAIDYKIDDKTGALLVPAAQLRDVKLKLAGQGLPRIDEGTGYELLDQETGFTTSKNLESIRYQRALEGEIARTVMGIKNIKRARVLLALPKQSVFVRDRKKPSASVMVELHSGRALEAQQIEAIVHLVAASVPMMDAEEVTVVDQYGRLLNARDKSSEISLSSKQFEHKKQIEEHLISRIENILTPVVGLNGLRTQLSADIDFTVTERTQELFNPDMPALRSEQTSQEESTLSAIQGVPGALTNQPPPAGIAPEVASGAGEGSGKTPSTSSKSATRNFELDKTITHSRLATGVVRRLSVAVVVDNFRSIAPDGGVTNRPYSQEELNRFTELVKQAVGFDASRGDQVTVTNAEFRQDGLEALPEEPLWEQPWFIDLLKQALAVLVVLFLIFGVLRPVMRGLAARVEPETSEEEAKEGEIRELVRYDENGNPIPISESEREQLALEQEDLLLLEAPQSYEKRLEYVQKLIDNDPKLVAQVIKNWVGEDGRG